MTIADQTTTLDTVRVGIVAPHRPPTFTAIPNTLAAQQAVVGGDLECWAIDGHVAIFCNEEGRLRGLPYNRRITLDDGASEGFVGVVLLLGFNETTGNSESLTDADIARWTQRLLHPAHPEVRAQTRYQRANRSGHLSRILLRFDANDRLTDASARSWARSVARDWGEINGETRFRLPHVSSWIGWFSCSGHGGYVVITADSHPDWAPFAVAGHQVQPDPGFHGVTAYTFEEDCDWAVLESTLPALGEQYVRKALQAQARSSWFSADERTLAQQTLHDPNAFLTAVTQHQHRIQSTLQRFYPDRLPAIDP